MSGGLEENGGGLGAIHERFRRCPDSYFLSPSRNFWRPPGILPGSVRRMVPGSTRIDGDADVPVTLALISPRPCFMATSKFILPSASPYSPAAATRIRSLV